jgi:general L-amino acid transport system permease protein
MGLSLFMAVIIIWLLRKWVRERQEETGKPFPLVSTSCVIAFGLPFLTWLIGGAPLAMDVPRLKGFNFTGGASISPEYMGLLMGLVFYTSSFMAEIVRAGIQSVPRKQVEAARSIGLKPSLVLRLVVLPQGLRVIIPPLTSQMLNLTKNSSLAIAIGYPDFVSVSSTTINQTGQAVECVTLIMVVYLFFSLLTSSIMNWYNKRMALKER